MKKIVLLFGGLILLVSSCAPDDPIPVEPGIAILISPANDETCLDGAFINDTQSNVEFSWSEASNALSYEVVVTNLLSQSDQIFTSITNQTTLALTKAEPYSWYVKSIGQEGTTPSDSDQWKFYLAGEGTVNYAPFPSELISPRSGANVVPDINNLVVFSWNTTDVDDDIESFELYLERRKNSKEPPPKKGDITTDVSKPFSLIISSKILHALVLPPGYRSGDTMNIITI